MTNIFIISDTHFQHARMLNFEDENGVKFRGKDFTHQEECDELMIQNWNKVIRPQDHVYHLGDVFFGNKESFCTLWSRLMGKKRLIVGNHDDIRYLSGKNPVNDQWFFEKVMMWRQIHNMVLTHVPIHFPEKIYEGQKFIYNVHGHIHQNPAPTKRHYNACVEVNHYSPIHIEDLRKKFK